MYWARGWVAVVAATFGVVCFAGSAPAQEPWPWPAGDSVALAYGVGWTDSDGVSCTHGGVDLGATPGDQVRSPVEGTVAFVGRVPASGGGSTLAVTIATGDGLKVTCTPLERAVVRSGQQVDPGQSLGKLDGEGDGSSTCTHVHLSVRRGETRLDPMRFLGAGTRVPTGGPEPHAGPADVPVRAAGDGSHARANAPLPRASRVAQVARVDSGTSRTAIKATIRSALRTVCAKTAVRPVPALTTPVLPALLARTARLCRASAAAVPRACAAILAAALLAYVIGREASRRAVTAVVARARD
jgi:hypothetical protein